MLERLESFRGSHPKLATTVCIGHIAFGSDRLGKSFLLDFPRWNFKDIGRWALLAVSVLEKKSDGETATSSDYSEERKLLLSSDFIKVSYMHG